MDQMTAGGEALYLPHEKIHAREVSGAFSSLRKVAVALLLGLYYLLPWVRWDGHQAVLFDLPARRFYIFGLTLWPQDFIYLAWLLIMAALLLFAVTAVAGRLWCGYACPQTVWTEAFVWMERLTEGNFTQRKKLDRAPWSGEKILRKTAKQLLWGTFALWTGLTFVGFFIPITELIRHIATLSVGPWEGFWVGFYSLATYGNAGYLREQVCKYMCPYARFQSAMFDRDTLIVTYDSGRGEPRGGRRRGIASRDIGLGDCIDCDRCVQVCPTGIDIRKGLQYECIACASCVDACDEVMDRMSYPRGLIRYSTQNAIDRKATRVVRPRSAVYFALLGLLFGGFVWSLATRSLVHLDVIRDRNTPYRELAGGRIENVYTLRLLNKDDRPHDYQIAVEGIEGARVEIEPPVVSVPAASLMSVTARVGINLRSLPGDRQGIAFTVTAGNESHMMARHETTFLGPRQGGDGMPRSEASVKPWYRQLWPWLIMLPPAGAVAGGLLTAWLAGASPELVTNDETALAAATDQAHERDRAALRARTAERSHEPR